MGHAGGARTYLIPHHRTVCFLALSSSFGGFLMKACVNGAGIETAAGSSQAMAQRDKLTKMSLGLYGTVGSPRLRTAILLTLLQPPGWRAVGDRAP